MRRPGGAWTPTVASLLRYLRGQGVDIVPEPMGTDEGGREILSYIEGRDQGAPFIPEIQSDDGAERLGRLAARLRGALAGYQCPPDARWQSASGAPGSGEAVQHGDLGPWNLLWGEDGEIVGVLDWDLAEPGNPLYDTGYLAWFTVPLMDDARARARGFSGPPPRRARLAAFAHGTGLPTGLVLGAALAAQREYARRIVTRRTEPWTTFHALGFHENAAADGEWTLLNFPGEPAL